MSTDTPVYSVGESITLTSVGDSQGATDDAIFGTVVYDQVLTSVVSQTQTALTTFGFITWLQGALFVDTPVAGTADAFAQISGGLTPWFVQPGNTLSLDFFGLTNAAGATVIIPEPASAGLLALGLPGLVALARRRGWPGGRGRGAASLVPILIICIIKSWRRGDRRRDSGGRGGRPGCAPARAATPSWPRPGSCWRSAGCRG